MAETNMMFGIVSDVDTLLKLFEEFQKRDATTVDEKNKIMLEFFSRKENKPKVQDVLVGEDDFRQEFRKHDKILSGRVDKNGKEVWETYTKKEKESRS